MVNPRDMAGNAEEVCLWTIKVNLQCKTAAVLISNEHVSSVICGFVSNFLLNQHKLRGNQTTLGEQVWKVGWLWNLAFDCFVSSGFLSWSKNRWVLSTIESASIDTCAAIFPSFPAIKTSDDISLYIILLAVCLQLAWRAGWKWCMHQMFQLAERILFKLSFHQAP